MKINIERGELKRLLAAVKLVVPSRSTVAVLQHVLLGAEPDGVSVQATNLEEYLTGEITSDVQAPGRALLPMQTLKDLAKGKAGDRVSIELTDETELAVTSPVAGQAVRQQIPTIAVSEWPEMPERVDMQPVDTAAMLGAYARVLPAASTDPTRYALNGVFACPEHGELVATDGRRLYIANAAVQGWPESIWPKSKLLAGDLLHSADGRMAVVQRAEDDSVVAITANGWQYQAKCVDAQYPQYRNIVPGPQQYSRSVDLAADAALIKQAANGFGLGKKDEVCLYFDAGGVRLVHVAETGCVHVELPNSRIDGDLGDGEYVVIGWYTGQLLDTLAAGYTEVRIQSDHGDHKPLRCESPDHSGCAVVMPLRLGPETVRSIAEHVGAATHTASTTPVVAEPQPNNPVPEPELTYNEEPPDMTNETLTPKPNLTMVDKPEPTDPIAELDALVDTALESVKQTREQLMAVKKQLKAVKADHKQKARDVKSTQLLLDKLKNAAGF